MAESAPTQQIDTRPDCYLAPCAWKSGLAATLIMAGIATPSEAIFRLASSLVSQRTNSHASSGWRAPLRISCKARVPTKTRPHVSPWNRRIPVEIHLPIIRNKPITVRDHRNTLRREAHFKGQRIRIVVHQRSILSMRSAIHSSASTAGGSPRSVRCCRELNLRRQRPIPTAKRTTR